MKIFVENVFGLTDTNVAQDNKLDGIMQLLIQIRKDSKAKKDYATSDKIRSQLQILGIQLKDEKDGNISYTIN